MVILASLASAVAVALLGLVLARSERVGAVRRSGGPRTVPGLDITTVQFWAAVAGVGALTFVVLYAVTGLTVVSAMPAVVIATFPRAYFARKRAQRVAEVQEAWPDGLRDLLTSVRSGSSLPSAIETLAAFGPEPLRRAFQGFGVYARSLGVVPALEMVKEDLADPTSDRVIEVMILAHERGGTVVPEILSDLAEATTRDLWTMEQVRTEALEQKINSRVVFILPWLVLVAMTARSGAFREFYATSAGILVVVIGGAMSLLGMVVASRLGAQPAEPRVFGGRG
jgi:tight adherence protein B